MVLLNRNNFRSHMLFKFNYNSTRIELNNAHSETKLLINLDLANIMQSKILTHNLSA